MVDKERLIRRLLATFVDEVEDQVQTIRGLLDGLEESEGDARAERVRALFRAMHSLKGAARSVNRVELERLCHMLEDRLVDPEIDARFTDLLKRAADALMAAAGRLRAEGPRADVDDLVAPFFGDTMPAAAPPPPVEPLAVPVIPPKSPAPAPPARKIPALPPLAPLAGITSGFSPTVRLASDTLDALVAESGELVASQRRIERGPTDAGALADSLEALDEHVRDLRIAASALSREHPAMVVARRLERGVRKAQRSLDRIRGAGSEHQRRLTAVAEGVHDRLLALRMVPFTLACEGLDRAVAEMGRATGREVGVAIDGASVEVDRSVLEGLQDALRHLVRNAVDHGIEPREERLAAGKSPVARVTVSARLRGATVEVRVADDGRGIDRDAVRRKLAKRGYTGEMTDEFVDNVIFQPGFSTRDAVGALSGRGVGLDAVRDRVTSLNGSIVVESVRGQGTTFVITVPVTMSRVEALLVRAVPDGVVFGIASAAVERVVQVPPGAVTVDLDGEVVRALPLADVVSPSAEAPTNGLGLVVRGAGQPVAFLISEMLGASVLVLQALGRRLRRTRLVVAASHLSDGSLAPVLNADGLVRVALGLPGLPETAPVPLQSVPRRVLVAEDSSTTRSLVRSILESAGYEVVVTRDGAEAWTTLQESVFDAVVSDVDMPHVNGLELAARIRDSARPVPVVLLTSRALPQDVEAGLRAGARAYLPKSTFERGTLLEAVARLL